MLVNENSKSFVSSDPGFSPDRDGYGGTIVYQCIHCDHQTRWKSALKRHFLRMHGLKPRKPILKPGEKLYECILCDHSTKWQSAYRRHMRAKHGILKLRSLSRKEKERYKCAFCDHKEDNIKRLAKHIYSKHRGSSAVRSRSPSGTANNKKRKRTWQMGANRLNVKKRTLKIYEVVYNYDLFAPRMDHDPSNWL